MARDALAIPLSQQRAAVTLCDEKRREEPSNLFATIPVVPPSGNYRAYGDLLIVRNTFLPPHQFPLIGDGPRTNAYNTRYAASSRPAGITAALNFLQNDPPEPFLLFLPTRGAHPPYVLSLSISLSVCLFTYTHTYTSHHTYTQVRCTERFSRSNHNRAGS